MFIFSTSAVLGQIYNFGTKARIKPEPNYLLSIYGYGDLVREYGIGIQYQLNTRYNFDFSIYSINPNTYFKDKIQQWDYYDLKGYGVCFKPKYQFGKLSRAYVGLNLAYEKLSHDKVWVEYYYGKGSSYVYHYLEDASGYGYTIGLTFGNKIRFKQVFVEPFFGIGITASKLDKPNMKSIIGNLMMKNFHILTQRNLRFFK